MLSATKLLALVFALFHLSLFAVPRREKIRDPQNCHELLHVAQKRGLGPADFHLAREQTVFRRRHTVGRFGETVSLFECPTGCWGSIQRTFGVSPQGDLRWFVDLLGEPAASFFSYHLLSAHWMVGPSPEELNRAIEFFNLHRPPEVAPIAIRFYRSVSRGLSSPQEYVSRFASALELPVGSEGSGIL